MASDLFAIAVVGRDRPGILAAVARVLYELRCNMEDVSSTILRGHFASMLVVRAPEGLEEGTLSKRLSDLSSDMDLVISASAVPEARTEVGAPSHVVSVYGADRPGIVYRVSDLLANRGANITSLNSRLTGEGDDALYSLLLEVAVPGGVEVEPELKSLSDELGVEVSVHPIDTEIF